MSKVRYLAAIAVLGAAVLAAVDARAAALSFAGSDSDIGGTFFPGGTAPYVVVPWRSNSTPKTFDLDGNNVYGSAGYIMFATQFNYPNTGCCGSSVPFDSATYPNLVSLPGFVSGSQNLTTNKVGGWNYALIDDPQLTNGPRDFDWGQSLVPPVAGQVPYVKMGILDGNDIFGNDPKSSAIGAGRWGFTVGAGVPSQFRIGVMTDGLDDTAWAATEVLVYQVDANNAIIGTATTNTVTRNRFVDIHSFDIVGALPGDTFAIFAKGPAAPFLGMGAISGVTFDVIPEPASLALVASVLAIGGCLTRPSRRK